MRARLEPRGAARERSAAIGAHNEPRLDPPPVFQARERLFRGKTIAGDRRAEALKAGSLRRPGGERRSQAIVLEIPAKGLQADFRTDELDRARGKESTRVVNQPKPAQRRGFGRDRLP